MNIVDSLNGALYEKKSFVMKVNINVSEWKKDHLLMDGVIRKKATKKKKKNEGSDKIARKKPCLYNYQV